MTAAESSPRLVVDALSARARNGAFTLGPVSFTVDAGHPLAVVGAAGSGKSLLLSALAGLARSTTGRIERPERVAMVFQRDALDDARSAVDNVAVAAAARGIEKPGEAARAALARVGLEGDADQLPRRLSGGMKKRVGIARALAVEPQLLLADDPTAGLDPQTAAEVLGLFVDEGAGRVTVIATQDVDVVLPHVTAVLVLDAGAPVFYGPPSALAADAKTSVFAPEPASP